MRIKMTREERLNVQIRKTTREKIVDAGILVSPEGISLAVVTKPVTEVNVKIEHSVRTKVEVIREPEPRPEMIMVAVVL